jgi:Na+/glutamate symporter
VVGGVLGAILIGIIVALILVKRRKNKKTEEDSPKSDEEASVPLQPVTPKQEIVTEKKDPKLTVITEIKVKNKLGGGHFSDVYKGEWQVNFFFSS